MSEAALGTHLSLRTTGRVSVQVERVWCGKTSFSPRWWGVLTGRRVVPRVVPTDHLSRESRSFKVPTPLVALRRAPATTAADQGILWWLFRFEGGRGLARLVAGSG
jgi:hypothetical protein